MGKFRADINALRGIAASVVVLFHFGVAPFDGGFVGVDIFFVISGLLMTQIIVGGIDRGQFSIIAFYGARVRRIVPALSLLCATLLLGGLLWIDPLTLTDLAQNAVASLLFYSNILYATQSGYFAEASDTNWLLHSWTLSVEWQFYLVYPVILWAVARSNWLWRRRAAMLAIGCLACCLATMIAAAHSRAFQDYAFFLLPTRAWEMLAGGWLAVAAPSFSARGKQWSLPLLSFGGIAIVASVLVLDRFTPWPSLWLVLPIGGTVAVLAAGRSDARWTALPGLQSLGTWSYSIYLWHWPIVVALRYFDIPHTPMVVALSLGATLVLGFLSYELAETRLRKALFGNGVGSPMQWIRVTTLFLAFTGTGLFVFRSSGMERARTAGMAPARSAMLADYRAADSDWRGMEPCESLTRIGTGRVCVVGKGNPIRVAVLGDSHAEQMLPRLAQLAANHKLEITLIRQPGCPPLEQLDWTNVGDQCRQFAAPAFIALERGHFARIVVLVAWEVYFDRPGGTIDPAKLCRITWRGCRPTLTDAEVASHVSAAFDGFADRLRRLGADGAVVSVVLPFPIPLSDTPRDLYRRAFTTGAPSAAPPVDRAEFEARTAGVRRLLVHAATAAGAATIDPVALRCRATSCPVYDQGHYIFRDRHHLRASVVTLPDFDLIDAALTGAAR